MLPGLFLLAILMLIVAVGLSVRLNKLQQLVDALTQRIAALERKPPLVEQAPASAKVFIPPSPFLAKAPPVVRKPQEPPPLPTRPAPPPPVAPPVTPFNWEAFMGVKLFAWLGGLALFLGVVFLVKYSFENNLITPLGRVAIGGAVAAILIGLGWWLARGRYGVTAQSLCATGIVILYADLFAAHSFYGLISLTTAFFAMSAVALFSFLLAVNLSAQVIVILGLLGGFLNPVLLRTGVDHVPALFLYVALLDFGVAAVALRKRWYYLVLLASVGTVLMQFGWAGQFFDASKGYRALWIFLGFQALFLALFFLQRRREPNGWLATASLVTGFGALAFCLYLAAFPALARQPFYFFSFVFSADAGLLALPVLGRVHRGTAVAAGALTFALVAQWIALFAPQTPLLASLVAIVIFALLHAATTPVSAWKPGLLPFTALGTITPFALLVILIGRVDLWNPTPVFTIALLIALILLAAAIVRRADWLALAALVGTAMVEWTWQGVRFSGAQAGPALVCYALFLLIFVAFPFCSAEKEKPWSWAISALAQALQFWLVYRVISLAFPNEWMGLLPAIFVLPGAMGVWSLLKLYRADPAAGDVRLAWQGGALLLFVSLIFPLQFEREWITLAWALEGLALLWLFGRLPHRGLRVVAFALLAAAFARLAFNPAVFEYHKRTGTRIWNWYLYAYGVTSLCLLAGARLFGDPRPTAGERMAPAALGPLGAILIFLLLNIEIADYFSIGPTLTFSFSGNFARDMTYSIAWALFALGLIVIGMRIKQRAARYAGVGLLGITLAKLFLHDLNDLDELYRIGAFVSVAVVLIAASFIYQRFLVPEQTAK
ncbi:MAG: DUF2339 domain-containing protein [Verrucomicrobiota bacterium]|nr:DUF2339 domain-containing protein [Verrucomicrobiota bacterium]